MKYQSMHRNYVVNPLMSYVSKRSHCQVIRGHWAALNCFFSSQLDTSLYTWRVLTADTLSQ